MREHDVMLDVDVADKLKRWENEAVRGEIHDNMFVKLASCAV
jgi:hypothetical protein